MPRIAQGMKKSLIGAVTTIAVCLLGAVPAVAVYGDEPSQPQNGSTATVQSNQSDHQQTSQGSAEQSHASLTPDAQDNMSKDAAYTPTIQKASQGRQSNATNASQPIDDSQAKSASTPTTEYEVLAQLAADNKDVIKDGIYAFASGVGGGQVMDVNAGSGANSANVQTYSNNHTSAQRWKVTHDADGFIVLTNLKSGKVLDVHGAAAKVKANVQQYSANGTAAQRWVAVPASDGNGYVFHSGLDANLVLDVAGGLARNKTNVRLYRANGSNAQRWSLDTSPYVYGIVESYWQQHKTLGEPKANEQNADHYLIQEFASGTVYAKTDDDVKSAVYSVQGSMYGLYAEEGGPTGWLGYPITDVQTSKDRIAQTFEHGSIISRNDGSNVLAMSEEISNYWISQKGATGWLGWPKTSAEIAGGRTAQEFDGGTVYVYPNGDTVPSIRSKYAQTGSWSLGTSSSNITVKSGKYYIHEYTKGAIFTTSETDASAATVMDGDIYEYWFKLGGIASYLGVPIDDVETMGGSGYLQKFRGGIVYVSGTGDICDVHGGILTEYAKQGGADGKLGLPTSHETATVRKGVWQSFEHGAIYWRPHVGSYTISGEFLRRYQSQNAERGDRGFPASEEYNDRGHTRQDFEHGSYWQGGMPAGVYSHNVRWAGQPNNFYCAPASGYMIFATAGRNTAAGGAPLSIEAMAQYMHTALPAGTWEADAVNGMNNWVGTPMFAAHGYPSYEALRNEVMHSYETGYAPMLFTYERRGGAHPNGHANASFGHAMVVDAYNTQDDGVLIADPLASYGGSQKFWDRLGSFREYYMTWSLDSDPAAIITAR